MKDFKNFKDLINENKKQIVIAEKGNKGLFFGYARNGKVILIDKKYKDKVREGFSYEVELKEFDKFYVAFNPKLHIDDVWIDIEKVTLSWQSGNQHSEIPLKKGDIASVKVVHKQINGMFPVLHLRISVKFGKVWEDEKIHRFSLYKDERFDFSKKYKAFLNVLTNEQKTYLEKEYEKAENEWEAKQNHQNNKNEEIESLRKKYKSIFKKAFEEYKKATKETKYNYELLEKLKEKLPKAPDKLLFMALPVLNHYYNPGSEDGFRQEVSYSLEEFEKIYYEYNDKNGCFITIPDNPFWKTQREIEQLKKRFEFIEYNKGEYYRFKVDCPDNFEKYQKQMENYHKKLSKSLEKVNKQRKKYEKMLEKLKKVKKELGDLHLKIEKELGKFNNGNLIPLKVAYDIIVNGKNFSDFHWE